MYLLLAATCIGVIVRALWRPADVYRNPCCGACGHSVDSVLNGVCPECGGNYAKVGISTPSMAVRLRGSIVLALLAWSTLVALAAGYTNGWLERRAWTRAMTITAAAPAPVKQTESYSTDLSPWGGMFQSMSSRREKNLDFRVSLQLDLVTDAGEAESGTCVMKLRKTGAKESYTLTIDVVEGSYAVTDGDDKELDKGPEVDDAAIKRWFEAAGLETDGRLIKQAMADCAEIAELAVTDPTAIQTSVGHSSFRTGEEGKLQSNGSSSSRGSIGGGGAMAGRGLVRPSGPSMRELAIGGGVLGVVYVAGCVVLLWCNRRALHAVAA